MKTIQEHLKEADRKRLLDCLAYRFLSDPLHLLEAREYRKNYKGPTAEERMEMEAAFGKGTTVVNMITGKKTRL